MVKLKISKIIESIIIHTFIVVNKKIELRNISALKIQKRIRGNTGRKRYAHLRIIRKDEFEKEMEKQRKIRERQEKEARIIKNKRNKALRKICYIVIGYVTRKKYVPLIRARTLKRLKAALFINLKMGAYYRGVVARKRVVKLREIKRKKDEVMIRARKLAVLKARSGTYVRTSELFD